MKTKNSVVCNQSCSDQLTSTDPQLFAIGQRHCNLSLWTWRSNARARAPSLPTLWRPKEGCLAHRDEPRSPALGGRRQPTLHLTTSLTTSVGLHIWLRPVERRRWRGDLKFLIAYSYFETQLTLGEIYNAHSKTDNYVQLDTTSTYVQNVYNYSIVVTEVFKGLQPTVPKQAINMQMYKVYECTKSQIKYVKYIQHTAATLRTKKPTTNVFSQSFTGYWYHETDTEMNEELRMIILSVKCPQKFAGSTVYFVLFYYRGFVNVRKPVINRTLVFRLARKTNTHRAHHHETKEGGR